MLSRFSQRNAIAAINAYPSAWPRLSSAALCGVLPGNYLGDNSMFAAICSQQYCSWDSQDTAYTPTFLTGSPIAPFASPASPQPSGQQLCLSANAISRPSNKGLEISMAEANNPLAAWSDQTDDRSRLAVVRLEGCLFPRSPLLPRAPVR
jgi:hypothetical protein